LSTNGKTPDDPTAGNPGDSEHQGRLDQNSGRFADPGNDQENANRAEHETGREDEKK
jgi:hypothetical protein